MRDLGNGQNIWEMAEIDGARLMNLTKGLNMWEMTYICGKGLKYLRND